MHSDASEALELGAIRAALAKRARTPLGRGLTEALQPLPTVDAARARVDAVEEARGLLNLAEDPPVYGAEDVHAALEMAEKELVLEPAQLRAAARTMDAGTAVFKHLSNHEERAPGLFALASGLEERAREAREIERCFESDDSLADHASPELGPLRARVRGLEGSIRAKLGELLQESKLQDKLQESYFTVRNERHVLPIKASYKNEVKGIVHDASGSGQTVFIEPQALVDLGNRLTIAKSETREEELRILSRLTLRVAAEAPMIRRMMAVIAEVDFLAAAARLAIDLKALPIAADASPGFSLKRARHPILVLQSLAPPPEPPDPTAPPRPAKVIGNDFSLEAEQRVLIITGPNTGGKTVAMKTIGLLSLMARCGLHLPCDEGSRVGWYPRLEVAIGDMQSIASNLSTFAAHVKALTGILARARAGSLVLIDEIASDTDPTQGQALAQAVLERLADGGAHAVVTTHFERLKAVPFVDPRFRNAGVGFDAQALRPTYHVTLDVPQGSSGFDIAQSLGLPGEVVDRARGLIGEGAQELEALIKEVERRSQALEQARIDLATAREQLETERAAIAKERAQLQETQDKLRRGARQELLADIQAEREEVGKMVARLQAATAEASAAEAMRAANRVADQLGKKAKAERERLPEPPPKPKQQQRALDGAVAVGDWVHVPRFGRDGDVVALDGKMAHVALGNMRVRVPAAELQRAKKARSKRAVRPPPKVFEDKRQAEAKLPRLLVEELDVRGATVDEAQARMQTFLDYHFNAATTHVRLIHGHGTGALREALRDELRRSGYVKSLRPGQPEEGGDGATVIELG